MSNPSFPPPLPAVHRCANVCARFMARKDKEDRRQSAPHCSATVVCPKISQRLSSFSPSLSSASPRGSRTVHFAPRNVSSGGAQVGAHSKVPNQPFARSKLTIRPHDWIQKIPKVRLASSPSSLPAMRAEAVPCLIRGEMDLYAQ